MKSKVIDIISGRIENIKKDIARLEKIESERTLQIQEETYLVECKASLSELNALLYVISKVIIEKE